MQTRTSSLRAATRRARVPGRRYWDADFFDFVSSSYVEGDRLLAFGRGLASLWQDCSRLPSPERLVGVDAFDRMIEEARRRQPGVEFTVERVHRSRSQRSFDLVIASSDLHHVSPDQLAGAFAEISRVLDEHGRLIGREPFNADHSRRSAARSSRP